MRDSRPRREPTWPFSITPFCLLVCMIAANSATARSTNGGGALGNLPRLQCMSCVMVNGDSTQLDQFRVRQGLVEPWCEMEPVECAPQQDTCVTVSMRVSAHRFWIGAGCDQRVNYDIPANRDGCVDLQTFTRSIQPGYMEESRAFQQVCLCSDPLCNFTPLRHSRFAPLSSICTLVFWFFVYS